MNTIIVIYIDPETNYFNHKIAGRQDYLEFAKNYFHFILTNLEISDRMKSGELFFLIIYHDEKGNMKKIVNVIKNLQESDYNKLFSSINGLN